MNVTEKLIAELEAARRAAMIGVDREAFATLLSDDLLWTHATGGTDTKDSYIAAQGVKVRFLSVDPLVEDIAIYGDAAAVKSEFDMVLQPLDKDPISLRTCASAVWALEADGVVRLTRFHSGTLA
ncbi:hypothetical protein BH10PSE12_BH10PSE12_34090 [soil metagenome]